MREAMTALAVLITAAFADNPPLECAALIYKNSWETRSLIRSLTAVNGIPDDAFIERHADSLPEFRPEGLRHVLPLYMHYSLRHPKSDVTERLIFHLSPADIGDEYWRERLAIFTPAQKQAICEYVRFMKSELAGEYYDEYLERAQLVWECG
jgi:hypothetical protein